MEKFSAQTRGRTVDQSEHADLRPVSCHTVTAQHSANAVVPQVKECNIGGDLNLNVTIQSDAKTDAPSQPLKRKTRESIIRDQETLKSDLNKKFSDIFDGLDKRGHPILLNEIYTELYITEGGNSGVNNEHEVRQIESVFKRQPSEETPIICNDIFKRSPDQVPSIRTVLTKGIAGIGKTISVQKFILDWAEGKANQDIDFVFTLPFRDLNLKRGEKLSLMELLLHYFPKLTFPNHFSQEEIKDFDCKARVLFIFDGLDECRLALDFQKYEMWFDVTKKISVEELLTNLILGNLLPSALLWITSRPAAASQIPRKCIQRVTEVRGFNDPQKEEYFRKRIRDHNLAGRVISHIKSSRSLYIMCHIPVLCWISAAVLETVFHGTETKNVPKTLTEMYTHFLLIQTNMKNEKYHGASDINSKNMSAFDVEVILKLGHLAFLQLEKGELIFTEEHLKECNIDITEALVYSGVCTQIFKEEAGLYQQKIYCFVHLSIQEYFAALFVFHSFVNENVNLLSPFCEKEDGEDSYTLEEFPDKYQRLPLSDLYCSAVDEALHSENGHLDLFLRFLLGLSATFTWELLQDFLALARSSSLGAGRLRSIKKMLWQAKSSGNKSRVAKSRCTTNGIKKMVNKFRNLQIKPHRWGSQRQRGSTIQRKTGINFSIRGLLRKNGSTSSTQKSQTKEGHGSPRTKYIIQYIKEKIREESSAERTLNLFHCLNELNDNTLVEEILTSLRSGKLSHTTLEPTQCSAVAFVLLMSEDILDVFDLKSYKTSVAGRLRLLTIVKNCRRALLSGSDLPDDSCKIVASVFQSDFSPLVELDLSNNDLGDSGVELLCAGLQNPNCKLQILKLSGCQVSMKGCASLASALRSNPAHLRELDLSYNHPEESGARALSAALEDLNYRWQNLNVAHGGQDRLKPGLRKYASQLTFDLNTAHRELSLSERNRKVTRSRAKEEPYPDHPERFQSYHQVLCTEGLTERCYWEVAWSPEDNKKSGWTAVGVAYKGISRKGFAGDSFLGGSKKSWSLELTESKHFSKHNEVSSPEFDSEIRSCRVGVYLDWSAGTLSFYRIASDTLVHLHTFNTTFSEPVYPAFGVPKGTSVSLCIQ
ncbi:hypothetical protein GJAV_G00145890 [Gymnothorax javanicus]|nr:hypothetical protein GJAV_G00145890 [Gymnothorax javanicus]